MSLEPPPPSPSKEKASARVSIDAPEATIAVVVRTLQEAHQQQMQQMQQKMQEMEEELKQMRQQKQEASQKLPQEQLQQQSQQLQRMEQIMLRNSRATVPPSIGDDMSDLDRAQLELNESEAKKSLTEGSTASVTFDEAAKFRRNYEKTHMKKWKTTEPGEILCDIVKHHRLQLDDESKSTSATYGRAALRCANRLFVHEKRATNATLDYVRKMCDSRSRKKSQVQRATGEYNGCITLTQKDVRHLIHSVVNRYGDATIPTVDIQTIQQLVVQSCSGRRVCEMQFVAPADFEYYVFVNDSGVIVYRVIIFWFCWSKSIGPGRYKHNCRESVNGGNVEAAPVMWTLLLLQRLGIIEDAVNAYYGRGAYAPKQVVKAGKFQKGTVDLGIDKTAFLSTVEFVAILKAASKKHATEMHEYLLSDPNRDDGTEDEDGSVRLGDYALPAKLDSSLRAHIASQGKKPLYREIYLGEYPMSAQQPVEQRRRLLTQAFQKAGYLNSRQMNIGGTGARKWFAVANRHSVGGMDLALHNDSQMMNSSQIRHSHYIDHNSYRGNVPANLADGNSCPETDEHIAEMMIEDPVPPAYTKLGFFDRENFTPIDASLGGVADFLVKYAGSTSPNKVPFACPFRGCSAQIESSGDYVRHLHELCPQREDQDAICPCCNTVVAYNPKRQKSTASVFLVHLEQECTSAREMMQQLTIRKRNAMAVAKAKNPSLRNVLCTGCDEKFPSQKALAKHLRESSTCAASKNRKEGSSTKDRKWMEKFLWAQRVSKESPGALQRLITQELPPGSHLRPLKQWLAMQRRKDRRLSPEKEALLKSIGYYDVTGKPEKKAVWRVTRDEYARQLRDYRDQNGGKNPSMKYKHPDGGSLGKWLNTMRTRYNTGKLSSEQAMWVADNGIVD